MKINKWGKLHTYKFDLIYQLPFKKSKHSLSVQNIYLSGAMFKPASLDDEDEGEGGLDGSCSSGGI